ncbi:nitrogenase cofactor biosynthesis protein NifB [Reinekea thalattae]|uniref:FeMo cofactor biosynthesis protein NifB n=1 Tax=Reinekea thalattae TaxID=2593301 RepID=A0A5C8Z6T4_9GAMM|nr:nitrogenase cofactor biosynthesis protein NifB [Reinekea thalattae]TXR53019.1 nitrogenase cofactor biosynthesis protein NifB [Reinekea thalattae]
MISELAKKSHEIRLQDSKVQTHPCYSKDAHKYARIHLPVAPACNIQCNYCNRKFDCSNETRPGVVSKLLSPAEAIHRFQAVKKRMPELKVAGIAGPGDPLANPAATLATLKGIQQIDDDVHLCVSTNGLNLPEHVDALAELGVHHLTITINTLSTSIASQLYAWAYFDQQRLRGLDAAEAIIEQQLKGLSMAAKAGILIKVNTVLVPGINDASLPELAKEIQQRGAFLHNIMPLISDPAHGTFFGLEGIQGPDETQLNAARKIAGVDMHQMTHCQQCRADAVGKLSHDQSCASQQLDASIATVRIAVASSSGELIDTHFGHATEFRIFDVSENNVTLVETRDVEQYCHGMSHCDDQPLAKHIQSLNDCQQVLCARIGIEPWQQLEKAGISPSVEFALMNVTDTLKMLAPKSPEMEKNVIQEVC